VSEPVKQCTGESLGAKYLGPFLEGQVGGHHEAVMLIGAADDLKEQLGPGLGERDVSQFIDDQEMKSLELFVQSLKPFFLSALHELSDQVGGCIESNVSSLGTRRKRQGTDQMRFTGSRVPDEQHVFSLIEVFSSQELSNQWFIDRGLGAEVIGIDGFDHREIGVFDAPFSSPFLTVQQLPLRQTQQIDREVGSIVSADSSSRCVLSEHGGKLQSLQGVLQEHHGFVFFRHGVPS